MLHVDSTDGVRLAVHDLGGDGPDAAAVPRHRLPRPRVAADGRRARRPLPRWAARLPGPRRLHRRRADGTFALGRVRATTPLAVVDALGAARRPGGVGHSMGGAALRDGRAGPPGHVPGAGAVRADRDPARPSRGPTAPSRRWSKAARRRRPCSPRGTRPTRTSPPSRRSTPSRPRRCGPTSTTGSPTPRTAWSC